MKLKEKRTVNSSLAFWIDSSGGPEECCRTSFYGIDPKYYFYGSLNEVTFVDLRAPSPELRNDSFNMNCFDFLEEKINEEKDNPDGMFVGYFAYDLFNRAPSSELRPAKKIYYPDFFFAYFDKFRPATCDLRPPRKNKSDVSSLISQVELKSNMTDTEYLDKVRQIKEEIKAGNVYQVNLTREYSIESQGLDELDLYLMLREKSPNPYGGYLKTPFVSILSSSPEEFLYIDFDRYVRTRPIKGTLPKEEFDIDPKNQAENIMIVDLERNDLSKICEYGSISAKRLLEVETYKHLNHVVSTVEGKLRKDVNLKNIFEALFPGGSITGAPKIAAMKIIDKLEPTKRGAYTGSFGYIKTDGTMNFNILIRTIFVHRTQSKYHSEGVERPKNHIALRDPSLAVQDDNSTIITFNIGGGIVADSEPELELEEINIKAKGILDALNLNK